jgi:hypothetical protein
MAIRAAQISLLMLLLDGNAYDPRIHRARKEENACWMPLVACFNCRFWATFKTLWPGFRHRFRALLTL